MSHSDYSGHDTAPYPPPPPFGAPPSFGSPLPEPAPPDASDDDIWFQPVSYDQTDYRDLDAYLALDAEAGRPPSPHGTGLGEPAFPDLVPGQAPDHAGGPVPDHDASAWESPRATAAADAPADRDAYASADPYAYPGAYADPDPYAYGGVASAQPGRVADGSPGGRRPGPDGERPGRPPWPSPGPRRRPRWMAPAAAGLMAAAIGSGAVIVMTSSTSRPAAGLPMFSPGARPASSAPALITPGTTTGTSRGASRARPAGTPASPGSSAPAALAAPVTGARAQQVLSHYTTVNNTANGATSDSLIAGVETGSSLAIDQGIYHQERAAGSGGFPAFAPASARFYIPLEDPASYPHWFAVRVSNAPATDPAVVTSREYLVFTQSQPGGPWLEAIEPFIRKDKAPPPVALDGNGFAKAVRLSSSGLLLSPATASGATAAALNAGAGQPASPGNLAIDADRAALARRAPSASVTARHSGTRTRVFALRTADGGALLFYDVAARLTLTAPAGATLKLTIPGYLSAAEGARTATLTYLEQFATYDPPRGGSSLLPVIADYSAITGRG